MPRQDQRSTWRRMTSMERAAFLGAILIGLAGLVLALLGHVAGGGLLGSAGVVIALINFRVLMR